MRLSSLKIQGFRRLKNVEIKFGDATFLIGENNLGKSCVLKSIEILLSGKEKLCDEDYYSEFNNENQINERIADKIVLEAEFRNLPIDIETRRGFKGRVFQYKIPEDSDDTGLMMVYRKTFPHGQKVIVEIKSFEKDLKDEFKEISKPKHLLELGIQNEIVYDLFGKEKLEDNIHHSKKHLLDQINEMWSVNEDKNTWVKNPGGIMGNLLINLPKFLFIPAEDSSNEISDEKRGTLAITLTELFSEVRDGSDNFHKAQKFLNNLEKEMDPNDNESDFGKMMIELNDVLGGVFPNSKIHVNADLSDPNKALKPQFNISMSSNVITPVDYQGTGMVRTAVFALLRYQRIWEEKRANGKKRTIIIGFEEPEVYLDPLSANQMRDTIYELAGNNSQIISTTHSPFMIDLTRKPQQILNVFLLNDNVIEVKPFNVSDEFLKLSEDDKTYVKMLLKMDDQSSRVFFSKNIIIIEGDTEDIVLRETISRLPQEIQKHVKSEFQFIKARGKPSIISLVKYLKAMGLNIFVIHDRDEGTEGADRVNELILEALGSEKHRKMLHECIEDVLGYAPPSKDKPARGYQETLRWGNNWEDIPVSWRTIAEEIFSEYFK